MAKIISGIKAYWSIGLALLVTGLLAAVKILAAKAKRQKKRADNAVAQVKHAHAVAEKDNEFEGQKRSRRADAVKEIKEAGTSKELSEPNKW